MAIRIGDKADGDFSDPIGVLEEIAAILTAESQRPQSYAENWRKLRHFPKLHSTT